MTEPNQPKQKPNSHGPETHGFEDDQPPISGRKAILVLTVVLVVAAVVAIAELIPRLRAEKTLETRTGELAVANVTVEEPRVGEPSQEIVLPGNIFAYVDSPIYARTDGYLEKWYFDIGAHVRKGQLLADDRQPRSRSAAGSGQSRSCYCGSERRLCEAASQPLYRSAGQQRGGEAGHGELRHAGCIDEHAGEIGTGQRRSGSSSSRALKASMRRSMASSPRATSISAR